MDESTVTARKEICHANMSGSNSILAEVNGNCKTDFKGDGSKHTMLRLKMKRLCCLIRDASNCPGSAKQHCFKVSGFNYLFNDVDAALQRSLFKGSRAVLLTSTEYSPEPRWFHGQHQAGSGAPSPVFGHLGPLISS